MFTVGIVARNQCEDLGRYLQLEPSLPGLLRLIDGITRSGSDGYTANSIVAESGSPFEFSFSSRDSETLRLLAEGHVVGDSFIGNLRSNFRLLELMKETASRCEIIKRFLTIIFPPGELLPELNWKFAFFTSIRAKGETTEIRCYFNLLWGNYSERFARVARAMEFIGYDRYIPSLTSVAKLFYEWGELVGISCDFIDGRISPAKLHFSVNANSSYRVALLLNSMGLASSADLVDWFLERHPVHNSDQIPYLFSVDLGETGPKNLKLDMVLRGLESGERKLIVNETLLRMNEPEFSQTISSLDQGLFAGIAPSSIQYLGISLTPLVRYVNCYFSCPLPPSVSLNSGEVLKRAARFIENHQLELGAFGFESFDFGFRSRATSCTLGDLYMSALIQQCINRHWPGQLQAVSKRCVDYIGSQRDQYGWRYLSGLPIDVDDTAMAIISLRDAGLHIPMQISDRLRAQQLSSGGFRTFYDSENEDSHIAVTANALYALIDIDPDLVKKSIHYVLEWFADPRVDEMKWMYSPLLTTYLFARYHHLLGSFSFTVRDVIINFVISRRRTDGLWGHNRAECVETALATLTLLECGRPHETSGIVVDFLKKSQLPDGGWPWAPLFSDGDGQWFGQRALSTALCGGALLSTDF